MNHQNLLLQDNPFAPAAPDSLEHLPSHHCAPDIFYDAANITVCLRNPAEKNVSSIRFMAADYIEEMEEKIRALADLGRAAAEIGTAQIEALERQLAEANDAEDCSDSVIEVLRDRLELRRVEIDILQMQLAAALQARITELKFSKREAETRASDYANTAQELRAQIAELEAEAAAFEDDACRMLKTIGNLEGQLAAQVGQDTLVVLPYDWAMKFDEDNCVSMYESEADYAQAAIEFALGKLRDRSIAIVQATLEAAANLEDDFNGLRTLPKRYRDQIRAIDPQSILDGMKK